MSRVNLGRQPPTPGETAEQIISTLMARRGIRTRKELAVKAGMDEQAFRLRMRTGGWRLEELVKVARALRMSKEDTAALLGVK